MNSDFILRQEEKRIIEYVRMVLDLVLENDATVPLLYTKTYGIMSPSIVQDLINRGVIQVINHGNKVA